MLEELVVVAAVREVPFGAAVVVEAAERRAVHGEMDAGIRQPPHHLDAVTVVDGEFLGDQLVVHSHAGISCCLVKDLVRAIALAACICTTSALNITSAWAALRCMFASAPRPPSVVTMSTRTVLRWPKRRKRRTFW